MSMNFVTFNQDYSHLAVATSRGFRIYATDPFAKCSESKAGDIGLLEMLFSTSLVAMILSPRRLVISNTKRGSTICELTFPTTVLAIRLNRMRLIVVLEDQIYIYDISNMKLLHTIETSPNPNAWHEDRWGLVMLSMDQSVYSIYTKLTGIAICALSSSSENCYLAYPLPQKAAPAYSNQPSHAPPAGTHVPPTSGDVLLFDAAKLEAVNVITAHKTPLCSITINNTGTLLATASDKGTIIRVFSVPKADKLYQFRRGSMPSRIFSMSFNTTSSLLCVSSASETVHIFKLGGTQRRPSVDRSPPSSSHSQGRDRSLSPTPSDPPAEDSTESRVKPAARKHNGTLIGMLRRTSQNVGASLATSVGSYLPSAVAEMWEPQRDFAWCKIPRSNPTPSSPLGSSSQLRSVVAMSSNSPQVMVVTNEGHFYVFSIDLEKGGEGTLVKQYEIGSDSERLRASTVED